MYHKINYRRKQNKWFQNIKYFVGLKKSQQSDMLLNTTTVTEAIGDVDLSYNAVGEINITRYTPKEDRKKLWPNINWDTEEKFTVKVQNTENYSKLHNFSTSLTHVIRS